MSLASLRTQTPSERRVLVNAGSLVPRVRPSLHSDAFRRRFALPTIVDHAFDDDDAAQELALEQLGLDMADTSPTACHGCGECTACLHDEHLALVCAR